MTNISIYLPPANEVWDKVIFSQACVSHSVLGCHFLSASVRETPQKESPPQTETPRPGERPP